MASVTGANPAVSGPHETSAPSLYKQPLMVALQPFFKACELGDTDEVMRLIKGNADINQADPLGRTPLVIAASSGRTDCFNLLIEAGADINKAGVNGDRPARRCLRESTRVVFDASK
jgi:ankyrin repeat protein